MPESTVQPPAPPLLSIPSALIVRKRLLIFLAVMLGVASSLFGIGWYTQLRELMHGALISIAVFALLPFVIIAAGIMVILLAVGMIVLLGILGAFTGGGDVPDKPADAGEPLIESGLRLVPRYYRWLASQRHPVFWGVPSGLLLGGLALWLTLSALVLPGESRSVEILADVRQQIDVYYGAHKRYPKPDDSGHLPYTSLDETRSGVVLDGFGRPLEYRMEGRWRVASYRVRSYGYDGVPGGNDDLCVSGATKLARWSSVLGRNSDGKSGSIKAKLGAIRELRCTDNE